MALNRVHSGAPSSIDGTLSANGKIVIVNQNDILFGRNARVDVNSLLATTADISNERFMQGRFEFDRAGRPGAKIVNDGHITAQEAGLVGLVAPEVINNGVIEANLGRVELASGDRVTVDLYGDGLIGIAIGDEAQSQLVSHTGSIHADGGRIALTAAAGERLVQGLIDVKGELRAQTVREEHGKIIISAEGSNAVTGNDPALKGKKHGESTVLVSGDLDVSERDAGETGGLAEILGDRVAVTEGAAIDATGNAGGGIVRVGGKYQGGDTTPTANRTIVQKNTLIQANAVKNGNGGRVIVWADGGGGGGGGGGVPAEPVPVTPPVEPVPSPEPSPPPVVSPPPTGSVTPPEMSMLPPTVEFVSQKPEPKTPDQWMPLSSEAENTILPSTQIKGESRGLNLWDNLLTIAPPLAKMFGLNREPGFSDEDE